MLLRQCYRVIKNSSLLARRLCQSADAPLLVFSLDGTLCDCTSDHSTVVQRYISNNKVDVHISTEDIRPFIGESFSIYSKNLFKLIQSKIDSNQQPNSVILNHRDIDLDKLLNMYKESDFNGTYLYPNVIETLEILKDNGHKMAICSNLHQILTTKILNKFALSKYFQIVTTGDMVPVNKPNPGHLIQTIEMAKTNDEMQVFMIGDSLHDIKAAKSAGIPFIGLSYGPSSTLLKDMHPDILLDSFNEIPDALVTLVEKSTY
eukprot:gene3612-7184_t